MHYSAWAATLNRGLTDGVLLSPELFCRGLIFGDLRSNLMNLVEFLGWSEAQQKSMSLCLNRVAEHLVGSMDPVQQTYGTVICVDSGKDIIVVSSELQKVFEFERGHVAHHICSLKP